MPGLRPALGVAGLAGALVDGHDFAAAAAAAAAALDYSREACQLRTVSQRDWLTSECHRSLGFGGGVACYLEDNFALAFPSGLTLGEEGKTTRHVTYSSADEVVQTDLVYDGMVAALPATCTGGGSVACAAGGRGNNLLSQTLALELNAGFDACARSGDCAQWCETSDCHNRDADDGLLDAIVQSGWCAGLTVRDVLEMANCVLSGKADPRSVCGLTASRMTDCVADINKNFDAGIANYGTLSCASERLSLVVGDDDDAIDAIDAVDAVDAALLDFELLLGAEKEPSLPDDGGIGACGKRSEVMFVVDGSKSINDDEWAALAAFLEDIAPKFAPIGPLDSRLGLISYSDAVYHFLDLSSNEGQSLAAFRDYVGAELTRESQSSATGDALLKAWSMWSTYEPAAAAARDGAQRLLVLVSDGEPTAASRCPSKGFSSDPTTCARELLAELQAMGVTVAFVHVASSSAPPATLFEGKEDIYVRIDRYSDLAATTSDLLASLCLGPGPN